jgi:mRNA interferase RelE/StbE
MNRIIENIEDLRARPHSFKRLHGELKGLHSMRVGDYRIVFTVDDDKERVVVLSAAHRRKVYGLR